MSFNKLTPEFSLELSLILVEKWQKVFVKKLRQLQNQFQHNQALS